MILTFLITIGIIFFYKGVLKMSIYSESYSKHKNLKISADELGINWATLYSILKNEGVNVTGDKTRYGSMKDKLGAFGESIFKSIVPNAIYMNETKWQSKFDFKCNDFKIDVKTSSRRKYMKNSNSTRWAFSCKNNQSECDFLVCFCLNDDKSIENILLVPFEIYSGSQTISVSTSGSKWLEFSVTKDELFMFFNQK